MTQSANVDTERPTDALPRTGVVASRPVNHLKGFLRRLSAMSSPTPPRWALVTGVSEGGLGDALASEFQERGITVIATALDIKYLDFVKPSSTSTKLEKLQLDVTSSSSISAAVAETQRITSGRLDFLVSESSRTNSPCVLPSQASQQRSGVQPVRQYLLSGSVCGDNSSMREDALLSSPSSDNDRRQRGLRLHDAPPGQPHPLPLSKL